MNGGTNTQLYWRKRPAGGAAEAWNLLVQQLSAGTKSGSGSFSLPVGYEVQFFIQIGYAPNVFNSLASTFAGAPVTEKRFRIAGTNTGERPLFLVLRSGSSTILGNVNAAAGAVYDQTFTITPEQEAAGLHVDTYVQDQFTDGVWVQKDTFDASTATKIDEQSVASVTLPAGGIPDAPWQAYTDRGPSSSAPTASTATGTLWTSGNVEKTTVDADRLDKSTYREGIDKLEKAMTGKPGDVAAPPTTAGTPVFEGPVNANRLKDKLPTRPVITGPTNQQAITVNFSFVGIGTKSMTVDFSAAPFATPIAVFRGVMLAVLILLYFWFTFHAVRSAFAGK